MGGKAMRRQCATLALCSVWLASSWSWAHAATASPFRGSPASPRSLPADSVPAFGILDDNGNLVPMPPIPAGAPRRAPGTAPESTAPGPSLGMSVEAARAAIDACAAAGYRIGVAIIDSVGEARVLLTADGSDGSHVFVAMRKSLTALRFEMPQFACQRASAERSGIARARHAKYVRYGWCAAHHATRRSHRRHRRQRRR